MVVYSGSYCKEISQGRLSVSCQYNARLGVGSLTDGPRIWRAALCAGFVPFWLGFWVGVFDLIDCQW
jgi:hypothetical protein